MGAAAWGLYGLCARGLFRFGRLGTLLAMAVAILAAVVIYFVVVIASRTVTKEDMSLIPGGEKLARLLHMH